MPNFRVPGIGFVGLGQMDPASQLVYSKAMGRAGGTRSARKRRSTTKANGTRKKKRTKSAARAARMVKGSAAAKRYMAKIRKLRK